MIFVRMWGSMEDHLSSANIGLRVVIIGRWNDKMEINILRRWKTDNKCNSSICHHHPQSLSLSMQYLIAPSSSFSCNRVIKRNKTETVEYKKFHFMFLIVEDYWYFRVAAQFKEFLCPFLQPSTIRTHCHTVYYLSHTKWPFIHSFLS